MEIQSSTPHNTVPENTSSTRKWIIVLSIIAITVVSIALLKAYKPEAAKRAIPETVVTVETITAKRSNYRVEVTTTGTIEAETQGNLVAQIRGEIIAASPDFKVGGRFNKGAVLIQIDPRDYQAALSQANANLSQAQASYSREKASSKQAIQDWKRLGNTDIAPDLVQRKPQLEAAKAMLQSARASQQTALLNLERTRITAPYNGRIIRRNAVLGQYVGIGTPLAEIYSTKGLEVRLPISQSEYNQLGLEAFNHNSNKQDTFAIRLSSQTSQEGSWDAQLSRINSAFDINTRQIDIIASIKSTPSLKIGQFVTAQIAGQTLNNVIVVPNKSVREGSYVYLVKDNYLRKQNITIAWQDDKNTIVSEGLSENDIVVITSLNSTLAGAKAKIAGAAQEETQNATPSIEKQGE